MGRFPPIESSSAEDHKGENTNPRVMLAPPARSASGVVRVAGYGTGPIRRAARVHNWKIWRDIQRSRPTLTVANIQRYARFMPVIGGPRTEQAFTLSNGRSAPGPATDNPGRCPQARATLLP